VVAVGHEVAPESGRGPSTSGSTITRPNAVTMLETGNAMTQSTVEARLAILEAKEEVREFVAQYCTVTDKMNAIDELMDLFTKDAVMRNAVGTYSGRAAIQDYYANFFTESTKFARHHVLNQVITVVEPGVARHQSYFIAMLGRDGESKIAYGRYDDTIVKSEGRWQFKEKVNDVVAGTSLEAGWAEGFAADQARAVGR
jgi:uncharacterized protein (TIGR02246 family)